MNAKKKKKLRRRTAEKTY